MGKCTLHLQLPPRHHHYQKNKANAKKGRESETNKKPRGESVLRKVRKWKCDK
jgi:hypothetical protein